MNEKLLLLVETLVRNGIDVELTLYHGNIAARPKNGFYKSDGCAFLYCDKNDEMFLDTRYGEHTEVSSLGDVVSESYHWWDRSKERFDGWKRPAKEWMSLYKEFCFSESELVNL